MEMEIDKDHIGNYIITNTRLIKMKAALSKSEDEKNGLIKQIGERCVPRQFVTQLKREIKEEGTQTEDILESKRKCIEKQNPASIEVSEPRTTPAIGSVISILSKNPEFSSIARTLTKEAENSIGGCTRLILRTIIKHAKKTANRENRKRIVPSDVDIAISVAQIDYDLTCPLLKPTPSTDRMYWGRKLTKPKYTIDANSQEIVSRERFCDSIMIKDHWLVVEGIQPCLPENVIPSEVKNKFQEQQQETQRVHGFGVPGIKKHFTPEKRMSTQTFSMEHQVLYSEVTKILTNGSALERLKVLETIESDTGIQFLSGRFVILIAEGIRLHIGTKNIRGLTNLLKLTWSLMKNPAIRLEKYLYVLVPSLISCVVSKSMVPIVDSSRAGIKTKVAVTAGTVELTTEDRERIIRDLEFEFKFREASGKLLAELANQYENQKYKMAVPGPGHSEQEQELHKSLIRDDEDDAEVEQVFAASAEPVVTPPKSLNFAEAAEELRHAYDQKIRKRPTTPTSSCVLDGIAFFAGNADDTNEAVPSESDKKIKVSIPSGRRRKTENMSYSEFYESMANQIPGGGGRRMSQSGRTTPLHDYEGDILDENPQYKDKAPPAPVVHRRSSIEWENFGDMEEKMEHAEEERKEREETEEAAAQHYDDVISKNQEKETEMAKKKLAFHAKPPTVEITSPDAPHQGAFHDVTPKEPKVVEEEEEEGEEDDDVPTFSEDMDEARQQIKAESMVKTGNMDEVKEEVAPESGGFISQDASATDTNYHEETQEASYDPNAYPGYIWNYETQEWEYDPNYSAPEGAYDLAGYEAQVAAYAEYDQNATATAYEQEHAGYDQNEYRSYHDASYPAEAYAEKVEGYHDQQAYGTETTADPSQEYDYSAYGGYEGYLAACKAYEESNGSQPYDTASTTAEAYSQGYGYEQQGDYHHEGVGVADENTVSGNSAYEQNGESTHAGYGDAYQGYGGYDQNTEQYQEQGYQQHDYQGQQYDYSQYHTQQSITATTESALPVVPIEPLFKQRPQQPDPFGWDSSGHSHESIPPVASISPVQELSVAPEGPKSSESAAPARPPPARPPAVKKTEEVASDASAPARPPPVARPPPPRPVPAKKEEPKESEPEEDAWAQFKRMTEKVNTAVKKTESTLKNLEETSAANDIKDESYLANVGGSQGFVNESTLKEIQRLTEEKKMEKLQKKKLKQQGKKAASPTLDPDEEDAMDRAAQELAMKIASMRTDIGDWKAPEIIPIKEIKKSPEIKRVDSASAIPPRKRSSIKDVQQDSGGSLELPPHLGGQDSIAPNPKGDHAPDDPILSAPAWADFESSEPMLPPSESGFFSNKDVSNEGGVARDVSDDPFVTNVPSNEKRASFVADPFAPQQSALIDESYDPFAVVAVEEVVAMAKAKAEQAAANAENEDDFYNGRQSPTLSTPTPEGGSPLSQRPHAFEDDFKCAELTGLDTPTPLYDEDDSQPLADFIPKFDGDGWDLMVRHPIKKKSFMAERCWKPCYARLHGLTLYVYNDKKDAQPIQELLLQATYSLSDTTLQAYDVYGKIHTVKLQFVVYKEKVGIRPGQISRLVDGHLTKYGLPLEHSAQCTVLLKFGSLNASHLQSFVTTVEDLLFKCKIARTGKPIYKQDEVQIHCYDEYSAFVDKEGMLSDQRARVRLFCLAFLTGSPLLEVGLNDRRRQGKEIVRRKDILPMYTERWIRFEALEFHSIVNKPEFDKEQVISFSPPDGCFFEIMRFRVRPPRNREKAMTVKAIMKIAGSKVEIRIEAMAAAQIQRTRGSDERRNIPCEDIAIRFPIPEAWIYLFREERHWGVGSIHSKKLRPGKVKNLKDRLLGAVQASEPNLIECAIGEAKYEHVYRSLVWRIPRLPEKHHAAYKSHLLKCRFELSSFDLMPEEFLPRCEVDFTMPLATVSNTVVRSVSVEQHEDSDRVEKFVRYVAKYQYKVEIDYVQCADLDIDMADPSVNPEAASAPVPELHQPAFLPTTQAPEAQQGYRIDFNETEMGGSNRRDDSSSDDEPDSHKMPIIQIDMKNYGY